MQSINETFDIQDPQLVEAAKEGDLGRCQTLVQPLAAAVGAKHRHTVTYLLEQGAIIFGNVMVLALGNTDDAIAMFQTFLDHGWDINSKTDLGNILLKHTILDEELTRWFLSHGADPDANGKPGSTILDVAAANSTPAIFELLMAHGARLQDSDALHSAVGEREKRPGRVEMAAYLLDHGMQINALARREYPASRRIGRGTPLHAAVATQDIDRIELLIRRGADMNVRNSLGQTPLEHTIAKRFTVSEAVLRNIERETTGASAEPSASEK